MFNIEAVLNEPIKNILSSKNPFQAYIINPLKIQFVDPCVVHITGDVGGFKLNVACI